MQGARNPDKQGRCKRGRASAHPAQTARIALVSSLLSTLLVVTGLGLGSAALAEDTTSEPTAEDNEVLDILLTEPGVRYREPEWSSTRPEYAYCADDGNVRIDGVDPDTGALRGEPTILGPCRESGNGPEWGYARGTDLVSWNVQVDGEERIAMASRSSRTGEWFEVNPLPSNSAIRWAYPIKNENSRPWVLYTEGNSGLRISARPAMNPYYSVFVTNFSVFPKWIPGTDRVIYTTAAGGVETVNVFTQERVELLPATGEELENPNAWQSPENAEIAFVVQNQTQRCLQIYEGEAAVSPSKSICAADFGPGTTLKSPEVFVFQGRSYVSFMAYGQPVSRRDIYVASAVDYPQEEPLLVKTNSDEPRTRKEPEPFIGTDRVWIYYSSTTDGASTGPRGIWLTQFLGREQ